jgi:hypothetical protein
LRVATVVPVNALAEPPLSQKRGACRADEPWSARGVLAEFAFPATGMALASGPIARSKTGEHAPPFRGQCRSTTRALPHATETAQPADED